MIPIYKPYLSIECKKYAYDAISSEWISSIGPYKDKAEESIKKLTGCKYVLLLNSGTAAVHLISRAISHIYSNINKIIVPSNVYIAAWNGFLYDNKIKLIPIDANENTWCMDFKDIDKINDDTAILAVHNVSSIVNVPKLKRKYSNTIIFEDACEGFLGKYEGFSAGTQGVASAISFFGNKSITAGEGGALLTNNKEVYDYCYKLHGQGQSTKRYIHDEIGYNYRMTNIQAAILYGQLEMLPVIIKEKRRVFDLYKELISQVPNAEVQQTEIDTESSNWMFGIKILNEITYNDVEKYFKYEGIDIRPMFYPMSKHKPLEEVANKDQEVIANKLSKQCFLLPSYPELTNDNIIYIISILKKLINKYEKI